MILEVVLSSVIIILGTLQVLLIKWKLTMTAKLDMLLALLAQSSAILTISDTDFWLGLHVISTLQRMQWTFNVLFDSDSANFPLPPSRISGLDKTTGWPVCTIHHLNKHNFYSFWPRTTSCENYAKLNEFPRLFFLIEGCSGEFLG